MKIIKNTQHMFKLLFILFFIVLPLTVMPVQCILYSIYYTYTLDNKVLYIV